MRQNFARTPKRCLPPFRLFGVSALASLALLCATAGTALAQAESAPPAQASEPPASAAPEAPAPEPAPTAEAAPYERAMPPAPPRAAASAGNGYNPSATYGSNYPSNYYPPPPPKGVYRPFSFSIGAGPGGLALKSDTYNTKADGVAYSVRFGFGIQPDLMLTLSYEGAAARSYETRASQDAFLIGVQYFVYQVLYLRGGMGLASESEVDDNGATFDQSGFAFQGAIGVDLLQAASVALSLEAGLVVGRYPSGGSAEDETWTGGGLSLVFSLY